VTDSIQTEIASDFWALAQLLERVPHLRQLAAEGDGASGETLKKYPRHSTILSFRSRDGVSEVHEAFADLFYILDGSTTLVTGGTIVGAKTVGPGEIRGDSIDGGTRQELKAGDVAHVPAGLPHQMLVAAEKSVTCMVIKVQEVV
jgi:mannose-6-phosphate isomerase-like protein (cupin superfamily)